MKLLSLFRLPKKSTHSLPNNVSDFDVQDYPNPSIERLVSVFAHAQKPAVFTAQNIRFQNLIFGAQAEDVIAQLGEPLHIMQERKNGTRYTIFWYIEPQQTEEVCWQLHFTDDLFVAATRLYRSSSELENHTPEACTDAYHNFIYAQREMRYTAVWYVTGDVRLHRKVTAFAGNDNVMPLKNTLYSLLVG
jgi:hypothetical protein